MAGVVIVGAGPGIGLSVARRFAAAGMPVGLIARTAASTGTTRAALAATGVTVAEATADAGQDDQLTAALDALTGQLGPPEALIYNAGLIRHDRPGELSREQYFTAYAINVLGAMTAAVHLAPAMAAAGGGLHPDHRGDAGTRPGRHQPVAGQGRGPGAHHAAGQRVRALRASTWPR